MKTVEQICQEHWAEHGEPTGKEKAAVEEAIAWVKAKYPGDHWLESADMPPEDHKRQSIKPT